MEELLTGRVVVTGANGHVGRHARRLLDALPNEVQALDRGDPLDGAFEGAEVALLLAGSLRPPDGETYEDANVEPVRTALAALRGTSVRRVVLLSYVGADPAADNEYLRAKGRA